MAYGYADLSSAQEEAIRVMKSHDNILLKQKGFWTYRNCHFSSFKNGLDVIETPIWSCRITTLRVLARRNIVNLNEEKGICKLKTLKH